MDFQASKHAKLLLFSLLLLHFQNPISAEDPIFFKCYDSSNYTSGSQYETNLKSILSSLSTNGVLRQDSFYNITYGDGANTIYGFSQCMSAASEDDCTKCLINSTADIVRRCPNRTQAAIRYTNCILRYSNQNFFSQLDTGIGWTGYPVQDVSNITLFNIQLEGLMEALSSTASSAASKYSVKVTNYSYFQNIYGMAQCTRDLSESSCYTCLRTMISNIGWCCSGRTGGNVYSVSCNIRYDMYLFFTLPPPPPPPPPPPTNVERPAIESPQGAGNRERLQNIIIIITTVLAMLIVISVLCTWLLLRKKPTRRKSVRHQEEEITIAESFTFGLGTLRAATDNFSAHNKLGEGGFGPVYKGMLPDGREIAVKRLSKGSGQGLRELRNEVKLVAELQHRNLVRLLGWCIEEQEKILIYEYVANTSLDKFLFDPIKRVQLNWERRYKIIVGIARGLLYLHEESRLHIIHRDLKASNILLDKKMNPKITDFGLAKLFGGDESQGNTGRIAGTYGYMAPEYVYHGHFSNKSDIYSFGVLVLEMITGQKNSQFSEDEHTTNLLSYAWRHWRQGKALDIIDQSIVDHHSRAETLRCLHMGLLCVQDDATKRPSTSSVVLMLNSHSTTFPSPSLPAFFIGRSSTD